MRCSADGVTLEGPLDEEAMRDVWPKALEYVTAALERDGFKSLPADFLEDVATGVLGFYSLTDDETDELLGFVACEVQGYPQADVFNIAYCGGKDLHRWAGLFPNLEAEAARLGCDTVRITGRAGWGKVYPDYREVSRVFERKVLVEA